MKKTIAALLAATCLLVCTSCIKPDRSAEAAADEGYMLTFDDNFNPGLNYIDELGISIVIAMDVSGSMNTIPKTGGDRKYIQAAKALSTVAGYLEKLATTQKDIPVNVAVLRFSSGVSTVLPITRLDEKGIAALKAICKPEQFLPKGNTAIGLAIEKGSEILAQSGTIFNSLIIVTDGENTEGTTPDIVIEALYANRNNKSTDEYPVRTSTQLLSVIGFDIGALQFAQLHELGARITGADSQTALEQSLKALLEADITRLEGN